jgi:uncharacterized membrane protein
MEDKMTEVSMDLQALALRLEKLEIRKSKRNVFFILPLLIFIVGGVSITKVSSPTTLRAEKIMLVDRNGINRLIFGLENGTPKITMTYDNGEPCIVISEGKMCFYDLEKKARINIIALNNLDCSSVSITDKTGKNCVSVNAGAEGPYISIDENDEEKSVILSIDPMGMLNSLEISTAGDRQFNKKQHPGESISRVAGPPH